MDPLSGVASITAVVTIAAQSAKIIYGFILGLRDSSRQADQLAAYLVELQKVLQQIEHLNEDGILDTPKHEGLGAAAEDCSKDLLRLEKRVDRYRPATIENGVQKVLRHFKISLGAEDLDQMRSTVQCHLQALSIQLSIAGLTDLQRIDNSIQDSFTDFRSQIQSLSKDVIAIKLGSTSGNAEASSISNQTLNSITELRGRAVQYFDDQIFENSVQRKEALQAEADISQMMGTVSGLSKRVESLNNMSTEQYDSLKDMLSQLLGQAASDKSFNDLESANSETELSPSSGILTPNSSLPAMDEGQGVSEHFKQSIGRLSHLASKTGKTLYSQEAQLIIDDLEEIVRAASAQVVNTPLQEIHGKLKRGNWPAGYVTPEEKDWETSQDLRRIRGLLAASQAISLIQPAPKRGVLAGRKQFKHQNRCQSFQTTLGTITFFSTSQRRNINDKTLSNTGDSENSNLVEEYTNTVTFMPSNPVTQPRLFATFLQQITTSGSMVSHPSLSFCSVIPTDSKVFHFVKTGQLDALKNLLRDGKASLTDCDPEGRSLLSYAHYYCQAELCKFFVEKGADVNAREPALPQHSPSGYMRPVLMQISMRSRMNDSTVGGCRRVLLDAGADPTIEDFGAGRTRQTTFQTIFKEAVNATTMKAVLDIGGLFVDIEERFQDGKTPLITAASGGRDGIEPDIIAILLQQGANPQAQDLKGNTCLHTAVRYNNSYWYQQRLTRALVHMVKAGADVYAENHAGITVSETAIRANVWEAWSDALSICEIDADHVRDGTFRIIQADFDAKLGLKRRRGW